MQHQAVCELPHSFCFSIRDPAVRPVDVELIVRVQGEKLKLWWRQRQVLTGSEPSVDLGGGLVVLLVIERL